MRSASLKRSASAAARAAFFDAFESLATGAFAVAPPFFALLSFFELLSLAASFAGAAAVAFFDFGPIAGTRARCASTSKTESSAARLQSRARSSCRRRRVGESPLWLFGAYCSV